MSELTWGNLVSDAKETMIEQWLVAIDLEKDISEVDISVVMSTLNDCLQSFPKSQVIKSRCFQLVQEIVSFKGNDTSVLNHIDVWTMESKTVLDNYEYNEAVIAPCLQLISSLPVEIISLEFQENVELIIAIVVKYSTSKLTQAFGLMVIKSIIRANLEQSVSLVENDTNPNKSNNTISLATVGKLVSALCDIICYRIDPSMICDEQSLNVSIIASTLDLLSMLASIDHAQKVVHRSSSMLLNAALLALKHPYLNKMDVVLDTVLTIIHGVCCSHDTELLSLANLDSAGSCGLIIMCNTIFYILLEKKLAATDRLGSPHSEGDRVKGRETGASVDSAVLANLVLYNKLTTHIMSIVLAAVKNATVIAFVIQESIAMDDGVFVQELARVLTARVRRLVRGHAEMEKLLRGSEGSTGTDAHALLLLQDQADVDEVQFLYDDFKTAMRDYEFAVSFSWDTWADETQTDENEDALPFFMQQPGTTNCTPVAISRTHTGDTEGRSTVQYFDSLVAAISPTCAIGIPGSPSYSKTRNKRGVSPMAGIPNMSLSEEFASSEPAEQNRNADVPIESSPSGEAETEAEVPVEAPESNEVPAVEDMKSKEEPLVCTSLSDKTVGDVVTREATPFPGLDTSDTAKKNEVLVHKLKKYKAEVKKLQNRQHELEEMAFLSQEQTKQAVGRADEVHALFIRAMDKLQQLTVENSDLKDQLKVQSVLCKTSNEQEVVPVTVVKPFGSNRVRSTTPTPVPVTNAATRNRSTTPTVLQVSATTGNHTRSTTPVIARSKSNGVMKTPVLKTPKSQSAESMMIEIGRNGSASRSRSSERRRVIAHVNHPVEDAQTEQNLISSGNDEAVNRDVDSMRTCIVSAIVATVEFIVSSSSKPFSISHHKKFTPLMEGLGSHAFPVKMDLIYELANYIALLFMSMKDYHQKKSNHAPQLDNVRSTDTLLITQPIFVVRKFLKDIPSFVDNKFFRDSDIDILLKKVCGRSPNMNVQDFGKLLVFCGQKRFSRSESLQDVLYRLLKLLEEVNDGTVFKEQYDHVDELPRPDSQLPVLPFWLNTEEQRLSTISDNDLHSVQHLLQSERRSLRLLYGCYTSTGSMASARGEIYLQGISLDSAHEFMMDYNLLVSGWVPHSGVLGDLFKLASNYFSWLDIETLVEETSATPAINGGRVHAVVSSSPSNSGVGVHKSKSRHESTLLEEAELSTHLTFHQFQVLLLNVAYYCRGGQYSSDGSSASLNIVTKCVVELCEYMNGSGGHAKVALKTRKGLSCDVPGFLQ